jgi:hypothetical protein
MTAGRPSPGRALAHLRLSIVIAVAPRAAAFAPFGDRLAVAVEQGQPAGDLGRTVARQ